MNTRILKDRMQKWLNHLDETYQAPEDKPFIKIAEVVVILPALGFFYIWEYFNRCNMPYYLYFEIKDSLAVLYENLMPIIYISTVLSLMLTIMVPIILKTRSKQSESGEGANGGQENTAQKTRHISKFTVYVTAITVLLGLLVLLKAYHFDFRVIAIFLVLGGVASYIYLFESRNLGFGLAVLFAFLYAEVRANLDAKYRMNHKPTMDIVLKSYSDIPIMREGEKCRYILYKTSNYYFIKDPCKKRIEVYSTSTGEMNSFSSE
ncbi:hypothetical protein [Chryseobacterium kwangjuense]|uniref:Uncharacterized protein n=1 Tax=Chryseobacterium kwangjuense TaxID=267125 RepID=A0A135WIU5_9FLAO|nr:hypothetical protein [Chryseobacterium kwangjuense]KXH84848.1 hypothetical protein AU378_03575 [Chryseobacterium kwangjuense]